MTVQPTEDLLARHGAAVRALARGLVRDPNQAEDIAQEALAIAVAHRKDYAGLRPWLVRVAGNLARRGRRAAARRERRERVYAERVAAGSTVSNDLLDDVATAVAALPEPYRAAIRARYYLGLTPRAIAARDGEPVATVKTRLRRALDLLRNALDDRHGGDRRAWLLPLVPFAEAPRAPAATALAAGAAALAVAAPTLLAFGPQLGCAAVERPAAVAAASPADPAFSPADPAPARERANLAPSSIAIAGTAVDEHGAPAAGVRLMLWIGPLAGKPGHWRETAVVHTDRAGGYRHELAEPGKVAVACHDYRYRLDPAMVTFEAPTERADLTLHTRPHATIVLAVRNLSTGALVRGIACRLHVAAPGQSWPEPGESWRGGTWAEATDGESLVAYAPVDEGGLPTAVQVDVSEPAALRHRARVVAGQREEVELSWQPRPTLAGTVTDVSGAPIEGAIVFSGAAERGRGDEPFQPFRITRIDDGVRTRADGRFELPDPGEVISAWHEDHTPVTVAKEAAHTIVLRARGRVEGRLVDANGDPRAGASIVLDRTAVAETAADGGFAFDNVEAGPRGVWLLGRSPRHLGSTPGGPWRVDVVPGETTRVELRPGLATVELRLVRGGVPAEGEGAAVLVPAAFGSLAQGKLAGGTATFERVIPGDYWLISEAGHLARCRITGARADAEVGTAALVLRGEPEAHCDVLPAGAGELLATLIPRVVRHRLDAAGELTVAPLPAGRYVVRVRGGGIRREAELATGPTTVDLR